jgi:hypothetical protein
MTHEWTDQLGNYGEGEVECRNCGAYANDPNVPHNVPCHSDTPIFIDLPLEDADHVAGALGLTSDDLRRMK